MAPSVPEPAILIGVDGSGGCGVCAVTGRPAKYVDPLTLKPFADLAAFRALRAASGLPMQPARRL